MLVDILDAGFEFLPENFLLACGGSAGLGEAGREKKCATENMFHGESPDGRDSSRENLLLEHRVRSPLFLSAKKSAHVR
jgi:hypothetical protein